MIIGSSLYKVIDIYNMITNNDKVVTPSIRM